MQSYRQWLSSKTFEAFIGLGESFVSDHIEDYYMTPFDLGYDIAIRYVHDFTGRDALQTMATQKHRKKAWLYWQRDDVAKVFARMYEQGDKHFKYIEMPSSFYSALPFDRIEKNGKTIGLSTLPIYSSNVRSWIPLCIIDEDELAMEKMSR